jgi:microcystin degradation protein MlrC
MGGAYLARTVRDLWRHVRIQPARPEVILVEGTTHYREEYEPITSHIVSVDSLGLNVTDPDSLDHEHSSRLVVSIDGMDDDYPYW